MVKRLRVPSCFRRFFQQRRMNLIEQEKTKALKQLGQSVINMGFTKKLDSPYLQTLNPALSISAAIELAHVYKLELRYGITPCVARLYKENWTNELNKSVPAGNYGSFFQDESDTIKKSRTIIWGGGITVQEAVCKCLVNARVAGVL